MKILAFTDFHSSITSLKRLEAKIKTHKPDYLFCLGDFTIFEQNIEAVLRRINDFKIPTFLIHGNHESDIIVQRLCKRYPNITFVHKKIVPLDQYLVFGHGGGGFYGQGRLSEDKDFNAFVKAHQNKLKGNIILLTHAPPAHNKLDYLDYIGDHVGCPSYERFIKTFQPILALSGHLHENFNKTDKKGKTILANPGPDGRVFILK